MLHNILLIARREYLERIRTKGFIVATVLIPTLMGGGIFTAAELAKHSMTSSHIAIVASSEQPTADLKQQLEHGKDSDMVVDVLPASTPLSTLDQEIKDKTLDGYLVVHEASAGAQKSYDFKPRSSADIATSSAVTDALHRVLTREYLSAHGISASDTDVLMQPPTVNILDPNGGKGDTKKAFYVAYTLFFLMYMVVLLYGMNVARSIIEEKTSRVFEVLLATIKPDELLAGKILGVGAVGLTQVGIWMTAAALFAAQMGAMSGSEQELQQLNMFLMMPLFFCMLMIVPIIQNPSSTLARVVSQIPFCAPLLMNFRISLAMPSKSEIALSMVLIVVTIFAVLWISARIYRVGILMYGKKPSLPEIMRWLKYS